MHSQQLTKCQSPNTSISTKSTYNASELDIEVARHTQLPSQCPVLCPWAQPPRVKCNIISKCHPNLGASRDLMQFSLFLFEAPRGLELFISGTSIIINTVMRNHLYGQFNLILTFFPQDDQSIYLNNDNCIPKFAGFYMATATTSILSCKLQPQQNTLSIP